MFKHCMEIVHNHGNVVSPERFSLRLVSITRQMPRPRHINKAILKLNSHPSRKPLCFDSNLVVVVVVIGLMETRL